MMNPRKKIIIIVSFILILIFLIFFSLVTLLSLFPYLNNQSDRPISKTYRYMEINPFLSETTYGFVKSSQQISNEDYFSFHNSVTGNLIVLSNFVGQEYKCTGHCICQNTGRRTATSLTRSFSILITAFSATLASKIAKEAFKDSCIQEFSTTNDDDEFDFTKQKEELEESCYPYDLVVPAMDCVLPIEEDQALKEDGDGKWKKFYCQGNCVDTEHRWVNDPLQCYELETNGEVEYFNPRKVNGLLKYSKIDGAAFVKAQQVFVEKYLDEFCSTQSMKNGKQLCKALDKTIRRARNINCYDLTSGNMNIFG